MKTTKSSGSFDCVEFKREAQQCVYEAVRDLSASQEIEYFERAADAGPPGHCWRSLRQPPRPTTGEAARRG